MRRWSLFLTLLLACLLHISVNAFAQAQNRPEKVQPEWIWKQVDNQPANELYFRKEFQVRGEVKAARLYATCDNELTLFLDGKQILHDAEWESPAYADVSELFAGDKAKGKHVLAVHAKNHGPSPAGLLVKLELDSGWRNVWSFVTDSSWQVSRQPAENWKNSKFAGNWDKATVVGKLGGGPWTSINDKSLNVAAKLKTPQATPVESLVVPEGFEVELLYSVPKGTQGSWVNMCSDPQGRLIVSDQYGGLFRVTPPAPGTDASVKIEKINVDIGEAQGLLWAFDSLYVVVNRGQKYKSGLYRVRDTNGDDQLDQLETLRELQGGGEHGPHAILLAPDGKSLFVVCGNGTQLTDISSSRVPQVWDEDLLLPRAYGRGFMKGKPAPGGYICRIDPDGKEWELVATGFRNEFDAALNADGELFTYDADMEWDANTPWYRPTRVCHVTSGAEFGWRNGAGKWPVYYQDSLPPTINIGPGSPTGICFGYGSRFPEKYQRALFVADWSYGKLYAVHLTPDGSSYRGKMEEFIAGTPLPLTDVIINPHDGAMYFAIGGRRVQSGLYRVRYVGDESTEKTAGHDADFAEQRQQRRDLEKLHMGDHPNAVEQAWPHLASSDRFLRFAARVALEHRPVEEYWQRALDEENPDACLTALLAAVRQTKRNSVPGSLDCPLPNWTDADSHQAKGNAVQQWRELQAAVSRFDWQGLSPSQRLLLIRLYTVASCRLGRPPQAMRGAWIGQFEQALPDGDPRVDSEVAQWLVYLQAPYAAEKIVSLLGNAKTQEAQIDFAKTLRHLRSGWTPKLRREYLEWFVKAGGFRGGASFGLFVQNIKNDARQQLTAAEQAEFKELLDASAELSATPLAAKPRPFVKEWKMEELLPLVSTDLSKRDLQHGEKMFAAANCFACHRFDGQGGAVGPDLTSLAGRFSKRDILESVLDPDKVISDQYAAVTILQIDGRVVTGRIVNLAGDSLRINTDMLDPNKQVSVDRKQIDEMFPSKTSMMPKGLIDTLNQDEVLDLMAYLLSRGQVKTE